MNLFSDIFDAIEKAFKTIRDIANLPMETRNDLRDTFDQTFKLLDTTLNMVIIRLGDILRLTDDNAFAMEVSLLAVDGNWSQAEREFRLCRSLRHTVNEAGRLKKNLLNHVSVQDWGEMHAQMEKILYGEDRLGDYIADKFKSLSNSVSLQGASPQQTRHSLKDFLQELNTERRRLISMEIAVYGLF